MSKVSPFRIMKEMRELPVEKYDLVLNDFEMHHFTCLRLQESAICELRPPGEFHER